MDSISTPKKTISLLGRMEFYVDWENIFVYKYWLIQWYKISTWEIIEDKPSLNYLRENTKNITIVNDEEYKTWFPNMPIDITKAEEE